MKELSLFLFIFMLPNTLFSYDHFLTSYCTGLASVSGDIDTARLSACFNDLINGINETRRTLEDKDYQTREEVVRVGSRIETIQRTVRDLINVPDERRRSGSDPDQVINSLLTQREKEIEKRNKETESKIEQLEKRISALEALLSKFTDEDKASKENGK